MAIRCRLGEYPTDKARIPGRGMEAIGIACAAVSFLATAIFLGSDLLVTPLPVVKEALLLSAGPQEGTSPVPEAPQFLRKNWVHLKGPSGPAATARPRSLRFTPDGWEGQDPEVFERLNGLAVHELARPPKGPQKVDRLLEATSAGERRP
jgi:hypothetical protein